ncbi:hypothetical protein OUZ56_031171 [Daphnia magna]|uniref:Uncharacterized protein n=1 Tax=Daphnia magna TaxID=35525 RepID=A0ABQ9ZTH0_9CRUS|nr:hypothetical protein OUZ56_031171 [Daphnia magna]
MVSDFDCWTEQEPAVMQPRPMTTKQNNNCGEKEQTKGEECNCLEVQSNGNQKSRYKDWPTNATLRHTDAIYTQQRQHQLLVLDVNKVDWKMKKLIRKQVAQKTMATQQDSRRHIESQTRKTWPRVLKQKTKQTKNQTIPTRKKTQLYAKDVGIWRRCFFLTLRQTCPFSFLLTRFLALHTHEADSLPAFSLFCVRDKDVAVTRPVDYQPCSGAAASCTYTLQHQQES